MFCFLAKNSDFSKFYPKKSGGDSFSPHFSMSEARVAFTPAQGGVKHHKTNQPKHEITRNPDSGSYTHESIDSHGS
jgi:hypothetical protein